MPARPAQLPAVVRVPFVDDVGTFSFCFQTGRDTAAAPRVFAGLRAPDASGGASFCASGAPTPVHPEKGDGESKQRPSPVTTGSQMKSFGRPVFFIHFSPRFSSDTAAARTNLLRRVGCCRRFLLCWLLFDYRRAVPWVIYEKPISYEQ